MIIYKTITQARESNITKFPGIYYFRNKINNKYYIGQAICIKRRFQAHCQQIQLKNNKYPIYKAINKYGEENFEFGIIGIIKSPQESQEILKKKLDILEIKYIEEYNSYGNFGYNQTKGGDGGILGYKMTDEQKKHISSNSKKIANDGRNSILVYNIIENKEYLFSSFTDASEKLNINKDILYSAYRRKGIGNKKYIISKTKEDLYDMIKKFNETPSNSGHFKNKMTLEQYISLRNKYSNISLPELAKVIGVCKKTIYNYEHKLNEIYI